MPEYQVKSAQVKSDSVLAMPERLLCKHV